MKLTLKIDQSRFQSYLDIGKKAQQRIRTVMRAVANIGRKEARHKISTQFRRRTGRLHKDARRIRTTVNVRPGLVSAKVGPMPRLLNIFEHGATIPAREIMPKRRKALKLRGQEIFARGPIQVGAAVLQPRPVMKPALGEMDKLAMIELTNVLNTMER